MVRKINAFWRDSWAGGSKPLIGTGLVLFGVAGAGIGALVGALASSAMDGAALGVLIGVCLGVLWFYVAVATERRSLLRKQQGQEDVYVKPATHVRAVERGGSDRPQG